MPTSKISLDFKLIAVRVLPGCVQHIRRCLVENHFFMFGLLESCKLNKVNFGEYIVDILTRILCGEEVDALANAIIALLKDEAKREKRQINFVGDKSWKVITEKYIEFYKTII